jgi:hypothetical protein
MSRLNDAMRAFLRAPALATLPFYDMARAFMAAFDIGPEEAGDLLAQWIRESV